MPTFRNDDTNGKSYRVEDVNGVTVMVEPGKTIQTYKMLSSPFTKTADTPYFSLTKIADYDFTSPGTKTGLLVCSNIRLTAKVSGIQIQCNSASNPNYFSLPSNTSIDIKNEGEIDSLVFTGTGTVYIEGF